MTTKSTITKFGFDKDENNLKLKEVLRDSIKLKEVHIDIYSENPLDASSTPFMLLLRTIEKNTIVTNDDNRLIIKKNIDKYETHFMNVLFSKIIECYYKTSDYYSEFILNIQNIYYRITVLN